MAHVQKRLTILVARKQSNYFAIVDKVHNSQSICGYGNIFVFALLFTFQFISAVVCLLHLAVT